MENKAQRQYNYDLLRTISAFMVVLIHVNVKFLLPKTNVGITEGETYIIEQLINIITRFSVPCFLMLSGAFVLNNPSNRDFKSFYKKSFLKIMLPYILISIVWLVYLFLDVVVKQNDMRGYLKAVITFGYGGFWYMPVLIIIYMLVPILIRVKEALSDRQFAVFAVCLLVWAIISQATTRYELPYSIGVVSSYLSYFVMGNVLYNIKVDSKKKNVLIGIGVAILAVGITLWDRLSGDTYYLYDAYRAFLSPTVALYSILIFWVFKNMDIRFNWGGLGKHTYMIYLLHTLVLTFIMKVFGLSWFKLEIASVVVVTVVVFGISLVISIIISWIVGIFEKKEMA